MGSLIHARSQRHVDLEMLRNEEVQHPQQQQQQQQQQPSESLSNEQHDAKIKEAITHYETSIVKREKSAQETREVVDAIRKSIRKITSGIHGAEEAFCRLDSLHTFLAINDNLFLRVVLPTEVSTKTNKIKLRDFIVGEQMRLDQETMSFYEEMERLDQERHRRSAMRRATIKPGGIPEMKAAKRDWESGLLHVESTLRMSLVDDESVEIDIMQPAEYMNPLYDHKANNGNSEPRRKVMDAWHLVNMKSTESKLYHSTDKQNKERLENACLALNFKFDLKKNNAAEMLMQQQLLIPSTVFLNCAASRYCVQPEECKADQEDCASNTVCCKGKATEIPTTTRIDIRPDGGVNLRQGWDIFGMRQIKRAQHKGGAAWFHNINKCARMTERPATIVHDYIEDKTLRKGLALPFIFATGKTRALYLTTLDEQGDARIQVVNYPEAKKGQSGFNLWIFCISFIQRMASPGV